MTMTTKKRGRWGHKWRLRPEEERTNACDEFTIVSHATRVSCCPTLHAEWIEGQRQRALEWHRQDRASKGYDKPLYEVDHERHTAILAQPGGSWLSSKLT
jgi:hypothetical protein